MARGAVRSGLTRAMAFCLLCLGVCLGMLAVSGRAWAEETPTVASQDAAVDIELVVGDGRDPIAESDAPTSTREARSEAEAPPESLDAADSAAPIAADEMLGADNAEVSPFEPEAQSESLPLVQASDSVMQDNGIPVLHLSIDPDEYQKMIDAPRMSIEPLAQR